MRFIFNFSEKYPCYSLTILKGRIQMDEEFFDLCGNGNLEGLKRLISRGYDVNTINNLGENGLHKACRYVKIEIVGELINQGINMEQMSTSDRTPLMLTCYLYDAGMNRRNILIELVKGGADSDMITRKYLKSQRLSEVHIQEIFGIIEEYGNVCNVKPVKGS
jgi:hypothetical protein